jgi:hypothetical protein
LNLDSGQWSRHRPSELLPLYIESSSVTWAAEFLIRFGPFDHTSEMRTNGAIGDKSIRAMDDQGRPSTIYHHRGRSCREFCAIDLDSIRPFGFRRRLNIPKHRIRHT